MPGRATAKKIDPTAYRRLLSRALPLVPKTEEENERLLAQVNALMSKPQLSPEEGRLLDLLATAIERFEQEHYQIPDVSPVELLKFLMEEHGLRQRDLLDVFGRRSVISEVLSGSRRISKDQAARLGQRFHLHPSVFIEW